MVALAGTASAQVPDTDIWLAGLSASGRSIRVSPPVNLTKRTGYDNQPAFLRDGSGFLYVVADDDQTDVYRFDLARGESTRVTRTPESEYSPTPLADGGFSTVRVEADSTQRLWRFDKTGTVATLVASDVDSVGYHAWVNDQTLALFIVGEPHTLRIVDVATQSERTVARDIGRSILLAPGKHGVSFLVRKPDDTYAFRLFDPVTSTSAPLIDAVGTAQDAVWVGNALLMAHGATIQVARPFDGPGWSLVSDLAGETITSITRLAVSPDQRWIALVAITTAP